MSASEAESALTTMVSALQKSDVAAFGVMDYWTFDGYIRLVQYLRQSQIRLPCALFPGIELRIEAPVNYRLNIHVLLSDELSTQQLADFKSRLEILGRPLSDEALADYGRDLDGGKAQEHGFTPSAMQKAENQYLLGCQVAKISRESLEAALAVLPPKSYLVILPYDCSDGLEKLDWKAHGHDDTYFMRRADIFETRSQPNVDLFLGRESEANKHFLTDFKKAMGRPAKPVVSGSDAHRPDDYGHFPNGRITWIKADPTFEGLLQVVNEPAERCFIGSQPQKLELVKANPTKFIRSISIKKELASTLSEQWFDCDLPLNHDLIAIIGNKGQGKSALAEAIGLAGNTWQHDRCSFLSEHSFKDPKNNKAASFTAQLIWESGQPTRANLNQSPEKSAPELVKLIPQGFLEAICNEIGKPDETDFDRELRKVIFSHVARPQRLNKESLEELIQHKTAETEHKIASLKRQLHAINLQILENEQRLEPEFRRSLETALEQKRAELKAHEAAPVPHVAPPGASAASQASTAIITDELARLNLIATDLQVQADFTLEQQGKIALQLDAAGRLIERFESIASRLDSLGEELATDLETVGLSVASILTYAINLVPLTTMRAELESQSRDLEARLDLNVSESIRSQQAVVQISISECQSKLGKEDRDYHEFLNAQAAWESRKNDLIGDSATSGTIRNLEGKLSAIDDVLPKLGALKADRASKAMAIFDQIASLSQVYSELFAPIQDHLMNSPVARQKYGLELSASIADSGFAAGLFDRINRGVAGTFCGVDEGADRLRSILGRCDFSSREKTAGFLEELVFALEHDDRPGMKTQSVKKSAIVRRGFTPNDLLDYVFSLDYLRPRYGLRLGGRELHHLSPGERGTMLLVFYLLVDKSEVPIVFDQPEENLDNQTLYNLLVPCIKEAKRRRQLIMVTHNPNLAVVCDAEQLIVARLDKSDGYRMSYLSGGIENPELNRAAIDILEGTRPAFDNRESKYQDLSAV